MRQIFILLLLAITKLQATSIDSFTKGMTVRSGFMTVYFDENKGKVYLNSDKINQPFIMMTSLPYGLGSNDIGLDRGLQGGSKLVELRKVGQRIFLVEKNTKYIAETNNAAERRSVEEAFAESILASFEIVAQTEQRFLFDVTPFILSDRMGIAARIESTQQGSFSLNRKLSSVDPSVIKSFPKNTELQSILTFSGKGAGKYLKSVTPDDNHFTLRQRVSLVELPDNNYRPRVYHPFSGYWSISYRNYAAGLLDSMDVRYITRHRLEKKQPDAAISEAVDPIVYYVDNGAPEKIQQALIEGARWWNQAFEAAGYKNAYQVKVMPEGMDPMDVRYNVILWVHRATRGWSYGASITDPRTGEILKGHVTLGSLRVRQDLLIAKGLTTPYDNEPALERQQAMALARIKQLSAHEVGHTLGIAHNFASSVNQRASVMDYPHPLVTLKGNKLSLENAYDSGIGEWDIQTVKYGYADFSEQDEAKELKKIIAESKAQGLQFVSDPDARPKGGLHAAAHLWDNGSDAVEELDRIIKVRQHALKHFNRNAIADGTPFSELEQVLVPIYNLHRYQVEAAVKLLAGRQYQYAVKGEDEFIQQVVSKAKQKKAFESLLKTLSADFLKLDERIINLIPPKAYEFARTRESFVGNTGLSFDPVAAAEASAEHTLSLILHPERLTRLAQQAFSDNLSLKPVLNQLTRKLIFVPEVDTYSRQIQMRVAKAYLFKLLSSAKSDETPMEVVAVVVGELESIKKWIDRELGRTRESDERFGFLNAMRDYIDAKHRMFAPNHQPAKLPPGSPIGNDSQ